MKSFQYVAPTSLDEACLILYDNYADAKLIAGGQSLIPLLKLKLTEISYLVDLKRIPNMSYVRTVAESSKDSQERSLEWMEIGPLTTHFELASSDLVRKRIPLLSDAAASIGSPQVRNRGTIGGSLCHCDPSADLWTVAITLGAEMVVHSSQGERRKMVAENFFRDILTPSLDRGELLEQIRIPVPNPYSGYSFKKFTLSHGDFPIATVATVLERENRRCKCALIGVGGAAERPFRVREAEKLLYDSQNLTNYDFELAAQVCKDRASPTEEQEAPAEYKKEIIRVLTLRALEEANGRCG